MTKRFRASWVLPMIAVAALGDLAVAQQRPASENPELLVLARWVGSWNTEVAVPPNQFAPNGVKWRGTAVNGWIRDGRVLHSTWSVRSEEGEPLFNGTTETTYDPKTRSYRAVAKWNTGFTTESIGVWDEKSNTMSWTTRDPSTKRVTLAKSTIAGDGIEKWTVTVADPKLGTAFECSGINTRRSK